MNIKTKVGLHNEFRLERRKAIFHEDGTWSPGELVQEAFGYNLILNQGTERMAIIYESGINNDNSTESRVIRRSASAGTGNSFGGYISVGSGSGTLEATRTTLFNRLATYYANFHEREISSNWASYTQVYTVQPEQLVGQNITEVGLGGTSTEARLHTHALLTDSEGNPITITNKTDTEVVVIYAKVFMDISSFVPAGQGEVGAGENNAVLYMFYNNGYGDNAGTVGRFPLDYGIGKDGTAMGETALTNAGGVKDFVLRGNAIPFITRTGSILAYSMRVSTAEANGEKIKEIGLSKMTRGPEFGTNLTRRPVFRATLPNSIYSGHAITDELVGSGNGSQTVFSAAWNEWNNDAVTVKVNDVVVSSGVTINRPAGSVEIVPAPSSGEVKLSYGVGYIPKDDQHVLDISYELHFTDANA